MSLAIYAAPFNNNESASENTIEKKKQAHNRTQKRYPTDNYNTDKVNSVLQSIHNNTESDSNDLSDFNPPPKPQSSGVQKTLSTESMQNRLNHNNNVNLGIQPAPSYNHDNLELNNLQKNYHDTKTSEDYYKKVIPGNTYRNHPEYTPQYKTDNLSNDVLLQKLNYMIHLLEEKQDEKTNNVTEEVVLYSFLGIFIIFVVDSFSRGGKYIR